MSNHTRAASDLRAKLVLERSFAKKLRALNRRMARDFKDQYSNSGSIVMAKTYEDEFEILLLEHYGVTSKKFSNRVSLPSDIAITDEERAEIDQALALFSMVRATEQAAVITATNQKDFIAALEVGIQSAQEEEGGFTREAAATFAAIALARKLRGRESAIAVTETQIPAEAAKMTETEVLVKVAPSVTGSDNNKADVKKEWFTVGDEKVRLAHMSADGQTRNMREPFIVGGEQLRFPSDSGLGASAGNTINCRCTAVFDEEQIISERREAISVPTLFATVN